jgi:hypothetical protein
MLIALDEQAVAVERAKALGADDGIQTARPGPLKDALEERCRRFRVVLTFEQIELRLVRLVVLVKVWVLYRRDAAHITPIAHGDKEIGGRKFMERVLFPIQLQLNIAEQGRDPL